MGTAAGRGEGVIESSSAASGARTGAASPLPGALMNERALGPGGDPSGTCAESSLIKEKPPPPDGAWSPSACALPPMKLNALLGAPTGGSGSNDPTKLKPLEGAGSWSTGVVSAGGGGGGGDAEQNKKLVARSQHTNEAIKDAVGNALSPPRKKECKQAIA